MLDTRPIADRLNAVLDKKLGPHVTGRGGIVLLYGPYPLNEAGEIAEFYRHAPEDIDELLNELHTLKVEIRHLAKALQKHAEAIEYLEG